MKWRIRDIIDLEYLLHQDAVLHSDGNQEDMHERDRNIFLNAVVPAGGSDKSPDRQFMIKTWLNLRRKEENSQSVVLPGEAVESLYSSCRFVFLAAGLLLGAVSAASFLSYTGDSPVNVFVYLSAFVFSQLLLLLLLLALTMYRLPGKSFLSSSPLYTLIGRILYRLLLSARNRLAKKMPADRRSQAESILGAIAGKNRSYGFLFFLQVFFLTQMFAIGFNLGLLAATLFKVATADIAFGWQSTIRLSAEAVHALVRVLALPWSWAVQGAAAYPSPAQIEGSRIILKEGIYHLATPDLVSWWPFLCFAVAVYGLLPRTLLYLGAVAAQRHYLGSLALRQGKYEQLLLRMTTPLVRTRGRKINDAGTREKETAPAVRTDGRPAAKEKIAGRNLLVMIPDEIYDSCPQEEIEPVVNRSGMYAVRDIIRINENYDSDRQMLATLANRERIQESDILIIREAWQPPILEYIDFIRQVRKAVGDGPCIRIGLIGKPQPDTVLTPVKEQNQKIWERKITAIGDPCIFSGALINNAT